MRIRQRVLDAIVAHAMRTAPEECCGLLVGSEAEIVEAVATANAASDPCRQYEIAPADYFAQIWRCREATGNGGRIVAVVGAYHSHPHSQPEPSPTDLQQAFHDFLFLIAGPADRPGRCEVRAYRLIDGNLRPVELVPETEEADS